MRNTHKPLQGPRLGLFGRGGSGQSTTTGFLAQALAERGYPVTSSPMASSVLPK